MAKSVEDIPPLDKLIQQFKENKELKFSCLENESRTEFLTALKARANNPNLIDQHYAYLCGPAAFLHCVTARQPEAYMRYVLALATLGMGKLGNLTVVPSPACRNASLSIKHPTTREPYQAIKPVDWGALASLRDSENSVLSMDGPSDGRAGITLVRALCSWFSQTGWYSSTSNFTIPILSRSLDHLRNINSHQNSDICLLVNANVATQSVSIRNSESKKPHKKLIKKTGLAQQTTGLFCTALSALVTPGH